MGHRRRGDLVTIRGLTPGTPKPLHSPSEGQELTRSCFFCACSSIFCFKLSFRCCLGSFSTSFLTCTRDSRARPGQGASSRFLGAGPQPRSPPSHSARRRLRAPCCLLPPQFPGSPGQPVPVLLRGVRPLPRTAPGLPSGQVSQPCFPLLSPPNPSRRLLPNHPPP